MKSTSKSSATSASSKIKVSQISLTEDQIEDIAIVCHEANRALCITHGDNTQPVWSKASSWQRQSSIAGVKYVLENLTATSEEIHEAWMSHKIKDGWTLGPIKDGAKKTHPWLVPYSQLPESQRKKDSLFRAIVLSLMP